MRIPRRIERSRGRHALVDGIPFTLPVRSRDSPAMLAAFPISASRAAALLPGIEVHPLRLGGDRGVLLITVVNYLQTDIGRYVEFSVGIACTHGPRPAPPLLPALVHRPWGTGQFVVDLPVSSEVSVKGGKGIWGMPKHQASLNFDIGPDRVSSQYDLDGQLAMHIEIDRPRFERLPMALPGINYSAFRGMLNRSAIYVRGRAGLRGPLRSPARLTLGPHPRMDPLRTLEIGSRPLFVAYLPETHGVLGDHNETWFLAHDEPPDHQPEGLETVAGLGRSEDWLEPPQERFTAGS